ncbi:unnamed protein product [Calicophoron daubneyi]|uniref:Golgin subfamily A conserved domain-containing protein n=1 Tax=Calicophoron daubneyi TaxID=300641 RepID=A0AAV2TF01_CALDB
MSEVSRSEKLAAAHLKLKRFQQAKVSKLHTREPSHESSTPSSVAVKFYTESNEADAGPFQNSSSGVPYQEPVYNPVSSTQPVLSGTNHSSAVANGNRAADSNTKQRSLMDYFSSSAGGDPPSFSVSFNSAGLEAGDRSRVAPSENTVPSPFTVPYGPPPQKLQPDEHLGLQPSSEFQPQIPTPTNSDKLYQTEREEKEDEHNESFENMPTAATEKIMQLSQQLNGILQTSEELTSSFNLGLPGEDVVMDGYNLGHVTGTDQMFNSSMTASVMTNQSSPEVPSLSRPYLSQSDIKRSGSPTSVHSATISSNYERNVELASMLEKRGRAHERALARLTVIEEQSTRAVSQAASERANIEAAAKRDLSKLQEQIRAHAQTIGALVAEKTELQTKVAHLERLSENRLQEIEDISKRMESLRQQSLELEHTAAAAKNDLEKSIASNTELNYQLDRSKGETKREKSLRENLEAELQEAHSRLNAKVNDITQLELNVNDLRRQLELAQVYANQLSSPASSSAVFEVDASGAQTADTMENHLAEKAALTNRIQELEASISQASNERSQLESQYQAYVAQVEQQVGNLRNQLLESNKSNNELQLSLDTAQRQLREKADELATSKGQLELAQTQLASQSAGASSALSVASPDLSHRVDDLEEQLKKKTAEAETLTSEIDGLKAQLTAAKKTISEKEALLADRDVVLETATSERTALSRAMEQNRTLKQQLVELQDAFVNMSNKNMELTTEIQGLEHALKESKNLQTDYRGQLERLQEHYAKHEHENSSLRQAYELLSAELAKAQKSSDKVEEVKMERSSVLTSEAKMPALLVDVSSKGTQDTQLMTELKKSHRTIDHLSQRVEVLDSLVSKIRALCDFLESQEISPVTATSSADRVLPSISDDAGPLELIAHTDRLARSLIRSRNEEVAVQAKQNHDNLTALEQLPTLEEWVKLQAAHSQLEAKFLDCMDKLSHVSEERTRLEETVAQLEMEASTVGEYVTLFMHRRAAAARRARAREQLLSRLVQDRRRLRSRLNNMSKVIHALEKDKQLTAKDGSDSQDDDHKAPESAPEPSEESRKVFFDEFHQLLEEVSPNENESQTEAGFSPLSDEDAGINDEDHQSQELADDANVFEVHTAKTERPQITLEQLRKQALQHDCPNCKCCVGTLLEV